MSDIKVKVKNHTYLEVSSDDRGILYEIKENFTFIVDGHKFAPSFRMGHWDGKISLYNMVSKTLPSGLWEDLKDFAATREYKIELIESNYGFPGEEINILPEDLLEFVKKLNLHSGGVHIEVRDYQMNAVYQSLKHKRKTVVSSTGCLDPSSVIDVEISNDAYEFLIANKSEM